jgi:hypothetical protein
LYIGEEREGGQDQFIISHQPSNKMQQQEEHQLIFGKVIFDYEKKKFFIHNNKPADPGIKMWPANMTKFVKELPRIVMEAREAEKECLEVLQETAALLEKGENIDHLRNKPKDQLLSSFSVSEWSQIDIKTGKPVDYAVRVETVRYTKEIFIWIQFKYTHDDDPEGQMRTQKGQTRICVNKDNLKSLQQFVDRCIISLKISKITQK